MVLTDRFPPHAWLRKAVATIDIEQLGFPPHAWLRNYEWIDLFGGLGFPPHAWLRNAVGIRAF